MLKNNWNFPKDNLFEIKKIYIFYEKNKMVNIVNLSMINTFDRIYRRANWVVACRSSRLLKYNGLKCYFLLFCGWARSPKILKFNVASMKVTTVKMLFSLLFDCLSNTLNIHMYRNVKINHKFLSFFLFFQMNKKQFCDMLTSF